LAGLSRSAIDAGADQGEHLWHILHLVKNRRCPHAIEEPLWIRAETQDDVRVFE
jgi:hypothetical protein